MTEKSSIKNSPDIAERRPQEWLEAIGTPAVLVDGDVTVMANASAERLLDGPAGKSPDEWDVVFNKLLPDVGSKAIFESTAEINGKDFRVRATPLGTSGSLRLWTFLPREELILTPTEREQEMKTAVEVRTRLLKSAEEKFRLLFEESSFGIVQLDPNGDWITANPTFHKIAGRAESELTEVHFSELVHPKDRNGWGGIFKTWLSGNTANHHRCRIVHPDLSARYLVIWAQRMENEGAAVGLQLSIVDVTEDTERRLKAEAEKDSIRESLENIVSSMLEALVVLEPDGRIASVNKAGLELLGWREDELVGKPAGILLAGEAENIAEETRKFGRLIRASIAREVEMVWRRRDGSVVPVSFNASLMRDSKGKLAGIMGVARDQSENRLRLKIEETNKELARALKELKEVDLAKDDLVSMVGHELRGPLAGIRGFTEFLLEPELGEKERLEFSNRIVKEVDRLTNMVNDILDLSKMEAGKLRYFMEPTVINQVIIDCIDRAQPVAKTRNVTFKTSFEECPPVVMDVDRMKQVVDNLLSNAIKFSPENGEIELITSDHVHFIKVTVKDHGVGIPKDQADAIFNKFEQTPDGRRRVGTGLGMPIARSIIENGHLGRIWFESEGENKGTTFFFTVSKNIESSPK